VIFYRRASKVDRHLLYPNISREKTLSSPRSISLRGSISWAEDLVFGAIEII
jgi:hypothetical protein